MYNGVKLFISWQTIAYEMIRLDIDRILKTAIVLHAINFFNVSIHNCA